MHESPIIQSPIHKSLQTIHVPKLLGLVTLNLGNPTKHSRDPLEIGIFIIGTDGRRVYAKVDFGVHRGASFVGGSFSEVVVEFSVGAWAAGVDGASAPPATTFYILPPKLIFNGPISILRLRNIIPMTRKPSVTLRRPTIKRHGWLLALIPPRTSQRDARIGHHVRIDRTGVLLLIVLVGTGHGLVVQSVLTAGVGDGEVASHYVVVDFVAGAGVDGVGDAHGQEGGDIYQSVHSSIQRLRFSNVK
mmetsp:Transcript_17296/g.35231  ORF Transcript_17296/g.35231 Transcript_17296/m.35231 type:complete len:246 (-) Transcript_17296:1114-1851(-)